MEMSTSRRTNLLSDLHAFARRQDENFTTEAFAHLLGHLVMHDAKVATRVLKKLTGDRLRLDEAECAHLEIATQVRTADGQPDIEISSPGLVVIVEVKVNAEVSPGQISRYRKILRERRAEQSRLVLLTRFEPDPLPRQEQPDHAVRWYEVAEWLEQSAKDLKRESSKCVCEQFLKFLEGRGLMVDHVGKSLVSGIQEIRHFMAMLDHTLKKPVTGKLKRTSWVDAVGRHFQTGRKFFWVGIVYSEPWKLQLSEYKVVSGQWKWVRDGESLDLKECFFKLPKESQIKRLKSFIRNEASGGKRPRT